DDAIAQPDVAIERRVAVDDAVGADDDALADDRARVDHRPIANRCTVLDDSVRADVDAVPEPDVWSDKRRGVNSGLRLRWRMKNREHLRQRERRLPDADERLARFGDTDRDDDRSGFRCISLREVLLIFRKGDMPGFHVVDRRHAVHLHVAVAGEFSAYLLR